MKKIFFVLALMVSFVYGQDSAKYLLRAEYYIPNHQFAIKFQTPNGFHNPTNFGFAIGAERNLKNTKHVRTYLLGTAGFYNDVYFERVATLDGGFGFNYKPWQGIVIGAESQIGYNFARSSHLISAWENDRWVSKVDKSFITHRISLGLSAHLGYDFSKHFSGKLPLMVFAGYQADVIGPFIKEAEVPFTLYRQWQFGVKWHLKK
jgi:hypothetical protein